MKILKIVWGLILFGALVMVVQLADPPLDSPSALFERLPDTSLTKLADTQQSGGDSQAALLMLDYAIENDLPDRPDAKLARKRIFSQLAAESTPVNQIKSAGWAGALGGGDSFESLAGSTIADAILYGDIADQARRGALDGDSDDFVAALNSLRPMAMVFPPADGTITLVKAARRAGAINPSLTRQLRQMLVLMQADPKSSLSVEKFKENFMPMFELAKRCRTWGDFQTILLHADSPDQLKVLTKMASATPASAERLSVVLAVADLEGKPSAGACLDYILRQGPKGLDALYAALRKGAPGLAFVTEHSGFTPPPANSPRTELGGLQRKYQSLRYQYGPGAAVLKYLLIAALCGLLVLVVVPGRYLEKLIARPGGPVAAPGGIHYLSSALLVGAVLSVLAYLLSLAVRPAIQPAAAAVAAGESTVVVAGQRSDSAFLSGTVVLMSLAIHAVVWFFVRGKIRQVEDDEEASPALRLKRLENLEIFLDLPLFTGLALTVIAFILITLDAGMSRHFAYTSTVVGILSAVSLRIRYVYPLKERLIQTK